MSRLGSKKCCHDINKLKFNRNTKFFNLSSEGWSALKSLKKRKDIVIKAADKGGPVFVWRADLYQKLSDTSFYAKVVKYLTLINQNIVKNTIDDLIAKQKLPATAKISPSPLLELRVLTFYLKFANLTTQVDPSFLLAVITPNLFPSI